MADLFKIFNITPHCFDKELNPRTDLKSFYQHVRGRVLPSEDESYHYTPNGSFCFGLSDENYKKLRLDLPNEYLIFIRKLIDNDRMIFSSNKSQCSEEDFIKEKFFLIDGIVCSEKKFEGMISSGDEKITSAWHIAEEKSPEWWRPAKQKHRIPVTYQELIPYVENFLKFAPLIQIWDNYIYPGNHGYDKFHEFLNVIGTPDKKVEVEINVGKKRDPKTTLWDKDLKSEIFDPLKKWFHGSRFELNGISRITIIVWNEVHDRYLVSSKLGGLHLGRGPQEDKAKSQAASRMSPNDVYDLEEEYHEDGTGKYIIHMKETVFHC